MTDASYAAHKISEPCVPCRASFFIIVHRQKNWTHLHRFRNLVPILSSHSLFLTLLIQQRCILLLPPRRKLVASQRKRHRRERPEGEGNILALRATHGVSHPRSEMIFDLFGNEVGVN